jgi:hypothetical protein
VKGSVVAEKPARKPTTPGKKRKWERPRIKSGHLFESNSLACGKNAPQIEQCIQNPVMS